MKLEIILTPTAKDTFLATISFIQLKWGNKSAEKFVEKTYRVLDTISQQPYIFKAHKESNIRKGIITKQTSIVYRVSANHIELLFFWDNRQEPIDNI
jgi:plasmid stabilization system protein ParE